MAAITALFHEDIQHLLDAVDYQLRLKPETLQVLASAFLDEFKEGLSHYKHPMAMMYVASI